MGTEMALSYANLFMAHLEKKILESVDLKPNVWWRFIDDIFLLWSHGEDHLKESVELINNTHPTIKFIAEWSYRSVTFLAVNVTLNEGRIPLLPFIRRRNIFGRHLLSENLLLEYYSGKKIFHR